MTFEVQIHCAIPTHITLTEEMALHLRRKNLIADGCKTLIFPEQSAFFHYVRSFDYTDYSGSRRNHFLDATMCHINESRRYRQSFDSHRLRPNYIDTANRGSNVYFIGYLTHDDTGRVIDMRNCGRRSFAALPSLYDDLHFHREKSWKARDKKARRQWAVNFKKHIDTVNHPPIWSEELL